MVRISKCSRYVIDVTGPDTLSVGELEGTSALASLVLLGRARTMKIGRHVRDLHKLT